MKSKELVKSFFERAYNKKDFEYIMEIYSENYIEHTETGARSNKDAYNIVKGANDIFPDLKVVINDIVSDKDLVAVRLTFSVTHKGEFFGIKATNKTINFEAMEFVKVCDGKITESWGNWPIYDILEKLKNN